MEKVTKIITKGLEKILIVLMATIVLDVTWQIFTRFILKDPSSFTEELAGFLLIWIGLLGASYALYTRAHLGIDVLILKIAEEKRHLAEIVIYSLVFLFAFFIPFLGGIRLVDLVFTLKQVSPAIEIPMGYVYLVLPLTGFMMMFYSVVFLVAAFKKM